MKSFTALLVASSALVHGAAAVPTRRNATTATGVNLNLPANAFGSAIEGAAVNAQGDVFAADFRAGGQDASSAYAFFSQASAGTQNVVGSANPLYTVPNNTKNTPLIAGSRFLKDGRLLLADATNKRVLAVKSGANATVFCANQRMLQPNDLALSTVRDSTIYLSGQNFTADTTAGVSGDLWTCNGRNAVQFPPSLLTAADIHRTNGIETSPDGKSLYLSSAKNVNSSVVSNQIFKFALDPRSGAILQQAPTLFFDFVDSAATDIDGMRTDTDGNLFVTRNGDGQVVKLSPQGEQLLTIQFPGMGGPSNLEFGGPNGSTLFVIGKCSGNATVGCAASFESDSVGKAFSTLQTQGC